MQADAKHPTLPKGFQTTFQDCMLCHYVKGSHVAVHKRPPLDIDEAWERIAHRVPPGTKGKERPVPLDKPGNYRVEVWQTLAGEPRRKRGLRGGSSKTLSVGFGGTSDKRQTTYVAV